MHSFLKFIVIFFNLPGAVLAGIAAVFSRVDPWEQMMLGLLACAFVFNIAVIWRGRASPQRPFGLGYRILRVAAGILNVVWILFCAMVGSFEIWVGAVFALPAIAGLAGLLYTRGQKAAPPAALDLPPAAKAFVQDVTGTQFKAHYERHKAEIDDFERRFRVLLVDKYGFRDDFVQRQDFKSPVYTDLPLAAL